MYFICHLQGDNDRLGPVVWLAYTADMSELFTPLEWVFVIILALVPLAGIVLHLWIMLLRPPKTPPDDDKAGS